MQKDLMSEKTYIPPHKWPSSHRVSTTRIRALSLCIKDITINDQREGVE